MASDVTTTNVVVDRVLVPLGQICWRSFTGEVATIQRPLSQSDVTTTTKVIVQQVTESEYHSAGYVGKAVSEQ